MSASQFSKDIAGLVPAAAAETGTVHRAIRVLAAVAEAHGPVRVGEVAQRTGLAPSTSHRLLHLLRKEGWVQWSASAHSYSIGAELLRIASRVVASVGITDIAQEFLDRIVQRFSETVVLGLYLPTQPAVSFVARADGLHSLQYRLPMHQPLSLLHGASGKAILAYLPDDIVNAAWSSEPATPVGLLGTLPPRAALALSLKRIRKDGYAITEGERLPGAQGVAAPIFAASGVIGCLCITAPKGRVPRPMVQTMARELMGEAQTLSRILGATAEAPSAESH